MDKKLEQISFVFNAGGDKTVDMEFKASRKGTIPDIVIPEISDSTIMELYYNDETSEEYNGKTINSRLEELINDGKIALNKVGNSIPSARYCDITESELLEGEAISQENLSSKELGLWAYSGKRKIKIDFSNIGIIKSKNKFVRINFEKINNELYTEQNFTTEKFSLTSDSISVLIDTDQLGDVFNGKFSGQKYLQFSGEIEVECEASYNSEVFLRFPICITLRNTNPSVCDIISRHPASIDFGTSSTCVAIDGSEGPELLTISMGEDKDDNVYENPTNIMVYNWDKLYSEWKKENDCPPIINKGDNIEYLQGKEVDYDFGYSVKDLLGDADKDELNAILTLIKMIPYQIIQEGKQININPYADRDQYIYIVADPMLQDEQSLDPVAFYGYLMGRAINDVSKHRKIYSKFQITSPVKFNNDIKTKITQSLKYGLSRSVPKPLRSEIKVEMKFTEPVAYIGALCGTQYFQVDEDESKMFAVYDFGGGTLDYSYGTVKNKDDELIINVLGVGGNENIGGEKLIERMSFKTYLKNINAMVDENIPIEKPYGEKLPDDLPEKLVSPSNYSRANMNKINELISRPIFEDKECMPSPINCELINIDGDLVSVELAYDLDDIEYELEQIIIDTINVFANEMNGALGDIKDYSVNDVYIFKAGNSSKSKFVNSFMKSRFSQNNKIQMVDQLADGTEQYKRYAITPKTAVAFGQLKLNNFTVNMKDLLFKYYVGYFNLGTGMFKSCIEKNDNNKEWRKLRKITNDVVDIYYAEAKPSNKNGVKHIPIDAGGHEGEYVYVRIVDEINIEYCICDSSGPKAENESSAKRVKLM